MRKTGGRLNEIAGNSMVRPLRRKKRNGGLSVHPKKCALSVTDAWRLYKRGEISWESYIAAMLASAIGQDSKSETVSLLK